MRGGIRITAPKIQQMIDEGRGCGELSEYKPWFLNRDLPGRSPKIDLQQEVPPGWTTGRSHHLQNLLQHDYFLLAEWSKRIVDIREHYPLHTFRECMRIADSIGLKYPVDPRTGHPLVLTETFLLTVLTEQGPTLRARTIVRCTLEKLPKYDADLLRLHKLYWAEYSVNWEFVTPESLKDKRNKIYNIQRFYPHRGMHRLNGMSSAEIEWIAHDLTLRVLRSSLPLRFIAANCDHDLNLPEGTAMNVARHLLANRKWLINMDVKFDTNKPLLLLNTNHLD